MANLVPGVVCGMSSSGDTTITIKVKTLDSQTHTLQVNKQITIPDLKDQIASVTGVMPEQQRLICRGTVLKDDQLLSAYYVEDGHTLHLVVRPVPPSSGRLPNDSAPWRAEQESLRGQSYPSNIAFGLRADASLRQPHAIVDSLVILSANLIHLRQEYDANVGGRYQMPRPQRRQQNSVSPPSRLEQELLRPVRLANLMLSTRELLIEQVAESLLQLGMQLRNHFDITDPMVRVNTQSNARIRGTLLQNLGAFLLELGRTTLTLQMGQTPFEAIVNAGPAVFISHYGPNPLMVQPLPQLRTSVGGMHTVNGSGVGFVPRPRATEMQQSTPLARTTVNHEENASSQQPSAQRNPEITSGVVTHISQAILPTSDSLSHSPEPGVQVVPSFVTAAPGTHGHLHGLRRVQQVASGHLERNVIQAFGGEQPSGVHTQPQLISESSVHQNNERHGNSTHASVQQGPSPAPNTLHFRFSVLSNGSTENHQPSDGEVPAELFQLLRSVFPVGEIHVENVGLQGTATNPVTDNAGSNIENAGTNSTAINSQGEEQRVTDEGIFLSNLLRQTMPIISQHIGGAPEAEPSNAAEQRASDESSTELKNSDNGTLRQQGNVHPSPPDSKRQKME